MEKYETALCSIGSWLLEGYMREEVGNRFSIVSSSDGLCKDIADIDLLTIDNICECVFVTTHVHTATEPGIKFPTRCLNALVL